MKLTANLPVTIEVDEKNKQFCGDNCDFLCSYFSVCYLYSDEEDGGHIALYDNKHGDYKRCFECIADFGMGGRNES